VRLPCAVALALALGAGGCSGDDGDEEATGTTTAATTSAAARCTPGEHALTLSNGQAALMRVTPGSGDRALAVVLHGAGGSAESALDAFRGGWDEPGLVLVAPKSKGQTWSALTTEGDADLESVNLALGEVYDRCEIDRRRIAIGGFSDGASYALTLGLSNGDLFPAIMALSPGGIVGGAQRGVPRVFVSHGTLDDVLPIANAGDAVVAQLREAGYDVTYRRFRGGHEASPETSAAAVKWFLEGAP
jgi:predicted esterase